MAADDDLEFNPFYQALMTRFSSQFQAAQDQCFLVCIPQTSCLHSADLNASFVEHHILKASPYFKGQFVSTDPQNSKTLILEDACLKTAQGFDQERNIRILSEEVGYNKDFQQYRMLVLEEPLVEGVALKARRGGPRRDLADALQPKTTHQEFKRFLYSFKEHQLALEVLGQQIQQFNVNYMVLAAYLEEATNRLKEIWTNTTQDLLTLRHHPLRSDPRFHDTILLAVESHLLANVHHKIFPVVRERCKRDDEKLLVKLKQLEGASAEQLGVPPVLCCPLNAAVVELANLVGLHTPLEKLTCLKTTLDSLSEEVNAHLLSQPSTANDDLPCLTSDDLIPLLVVVLSAAKVPYLATTLYYIEQLHWSASTKDDLSFSLVTFKAAVEYVSTTDFSHLRTAQLHMPKKSGAEQFQEESLASDGDSKPGSTSEENEVKPRRSSRFDRQLNRITKMLDSSTQELATLRLGSPSASQNFSKVHGRSEAASSRKTQSPRPPDVIPFPGKPTSQLGDFLSSLKGDVLDSSFGKLS